MACKKIISNFNIISKSTTRIASICCARQFASKNRLENLTHAGQVFQKDASRNAHTTNVQCCANKTLDVQVCEKIPPKECADNIVFCDGTDAPLSHPMVCINLDTPGVHTCEYCGSRFIKKSRQGWI